VRRYRALIVLAAAAALPALAGPGASDESERNRRLLEQWRADPEHYARLRRDLKAFWELPPEQRDRLRRLDRELRQADARTQKRLWGVLERYAGWLERLPEADRQRIARADRADRVRVIREVRERQFYDRLPAGQRSGLARLPEPELRAQLDRLRREERELRLACTQLAAARPAAPFKPTRMDDFPADVRGYVANVLWHQMKTEEKDQLKSADGAPWPLLARTILELAEKHPVKLPGPVTGPSSFADLPVAFRNAMPPKDLPPPQHRRLRDLQGRWPEFAMEYSAVARQRGVTLPRQLGPCHPKEFDASVALFIDHTLLPKLTSAEKEELKAAEGHWPDYPRLLVELAKKHGLEIPYLRLPGPRDLWQRARAG
jgi:hypothetical protein